MYRHYVYIHRRADTGEVFYVGKGTVRLRHSTQQCDRAHAKDSRNKWWRAIVEKHGYSVEIVASCVDDDAAKALEVELIAQYGRANIGRGTLVNLTDGGDGHAGLVQTERLKRIRSENAKRPRTEAWLMSVRRARKNGGNGGVVKQGDRLPQWWRDRIAASKLGADNPMFGRSGEAHPNRRPVVDSITGVEYPTTTAAAKAAGLRVQTLHNMLTGFRPNSTSMRFA